MTGCAPPYREAPPQKYKPTVTSQVYTYTPEEKPLSPPVKQIAKGQLIVIDAGHGGEDRGTISLSTPKYQEKSLTLATAKLLQGYLKQMGYKTLMTRSDDTFIPLSNRAGIANDAKSTLFVSVHYNSAPSREASGIEVYYYKSSTDKERTTESKALASNVLNEVLEYTKAKSRGVKQGDYAVIRETNMPAILVEGGFLTNDDEMNKIKDPSYIKRLAYGIARGIDSYMRD